MPAINVRAIRAVHDNYNFPLAKWRIKKSGCGPARLVKLNLFAQSHQKVSNLGMRTIFAFVLVLAAFHQRASADTTNAPAPIRIGASEAAKHYDESAVVTGKVAQVTFRPKVVFLNIDKPFPDAPFTALIFAKDTNSFGDLKAFEGKSVEICGKIKEFKNGPEIVLDNTNQLKVLQTTAQPSEKK